MKLNFYKEMDYKCLYSTYNFQFSITDDEARKVFHKYGVNSIKQMEDEFSVLNELLVALNHPRAMGNVLAILRNAYCDEDVDLGFNYKQKYEELVALLEPHKIDNTMEPATTLKMILKYQTGGCK